MDKTIQQIKDEQETFSKGLEIKNYSLYLEAQKRDEILGHTIIIFMFLFGLFIGILTQGVC